MEKGLRKGRKEGLKEGIPKGIQRGMKQVVQRQLKKKFAPLPDDIFAKLTQADVEQLILWSEKILFAETLDDVFAH